MKINLGCGGDHKKGYLNIDAYDETIADQIMPAVDLNFDDNSVDEILMSQLIEHFGIIQSLFALSECFRVLTPKGKIVIETPDLRESFKIFLEGEREDRKYILPWIYGVDIPGMQHRFCFPDDLLKEELEKIGFANVKISYLKFDEHQPILRAECEKPDDFQVYQIISKFRKNLLKANEMEMDHQINSLEKGTLIDFFSKELKKIFETKNGEIIKKLLIHGSIKSPKLTYQFFKTLKEEKIIDDQQSDNYLGMLRILIEYNFISILTQNLIDTNNFVGKQDELFKTIEEKGKEIVKNLIDKTENEKKQYLEELSSEIEESYKLDFFSEKLIMLKANKFFQIGVKLFNSNKIDDAIVFFKKSQNLYRDQILTYWNLARLYRLKKDNDSAESYYKNALFLPSVISYQDENKIKNTLENELKEKDEISFNDSLISLRQIYEY